MKEIVLNAIDYNVDNHGLNHNVINIILYVRNDMTLDDVITAIKKASTEYCLTNEGKQTYIGNCHCFNFGDFDTYVPNTICEKYGIKKIDSNTTFGIVDFNTELVEESDEIE